MAAECLECKGNTYPAQLMVSELADLACEKITSAITRTELSRQPVKAMLDPYNPSGSTRRANFTTSRTQRYATGPKCHLNWAILDSTWEGEFCRVLDSHAHVLAWVKNHSLGFDVPYRFGGVQRRYVPDFIVLFDYGLGPHDPLHVVVEVKGLRDEEAKAKKDTMHSYWVPAVNALRCHGTWAFLELRDPYKMADDFDAAVDEILDALGKRERAKEFARFLDTIGGSMPDIEDIPRRRSAEAE